VTWAVYVSIFFCALTSMALTKRLPLRVTARRMTPGVCGIPLASSPLSLPEEMWRSFVKTERLSRRVPSRRNSASLEKKPSTLPFGGDAAPPGLANELCPLAELELFRLLPLRNLALCILMKLGTPLGENMFAKGLWLMGAPPAKTLFVFAACGVMIMGSSVSSGSSGSSSSEELLESSDPSMLMLPTELEGAVLPL
jgi:hypothetical protein